MARLSIREQELVERMLNEAQHQPLRANFESVATQTIEELLGELPVPKWLENDSVSASPIRFRYNVNYRSDKSMDNFDVMELLEEHKQEEEVDSEQDEPEEAVVAVQPPPQPTEELPSWQMEQFDRDELRKLQFDGSETCPRMAMFPKIRDAITSTDPYQSVEVAPSDAEKWFRYSKIQAGLVRDCAIFSLNDVEYQLFVLGAQLHIFHSRNDFTEPIVVDPQKHKFMNRVAVSACCKYIAIALPDELLIYELKNQGTNVVLFKNITDLKAKDISHLGFYGDKYERLYFVDQCATLYLVEVSNAFVYVKAVVRPVEICLKKIVDVDALKYSVDADDFHLLAVSSPSETAVYLIEPSVQLLHLENFEDELIKAKLKQSKEQPLDTTTEPQVNVLWRDKKGFKPQLVITFLNQLLILKLSALRVMPIQTDFVEFARVSHNHEILSVSLLSYNHLLVLQKEGLVVVALPLLTSFAGPDNSYVTYSDPSRYFKLSTGGVSTRQLALTQKANICKLINLKDYIDRKMLESGDSRHVFGLLLLISKQLNYSFGFSYQETDLTNLIFRSGEMLLESLEAVDAASSIFEIKIYWICELLVETKRQQVLWGLVYGTLRKQNKLSVFFDCVEQFLLKDSLNGDIPAETLSTLIPYFCQRNKQKTLLKALLHVNYEQHDVQKYLHAIGEKRMYTLYIYLFQNFTQEDEIDFFMPFVKLFASFKQALQQKAEDLNYRGKMCFWYLAKCFRGQKFPNRSMTPAERSKTIMPLLVQTINATFLKHLLAYDCKLTLETLLLAYANETNAKLIKDNQHALIQKFNSLYPEKESQAESFQVCSLEHIRQLVPASGKVLFSYFLCYLCQFNPSVKLETALDALETILSVPLEEQRKPLLHIHRRPSIMEIGDLAMMMLRTFKHYISGNRLYVKRLMAIRCEMKNLRSYLHFMSGDYHTSVLELLESPDKVRQLLSQAEVFSLATDIVKFLEERADALLDFLEFLRVHVLELVKIDAKLTYKLFRINNYDESKLLRELRKHPESRFELLTAIIKDTEEEGLEQNMQHLIDHLELACELHQQKLLTFIQSIQYPLDEGILICEKNNQFEGKAVLEERAGNIRGALQSRGKAIASLIKAAKEMKMRKLKNLLQQQVDECIKLCEKHYSSAQDEENYWLALLRLIQDLEHSGSRQKVSLIIELGRHFNRILQKLYSHVPLDSLNRYFISERSQDFSNKIRVHSWDVLHRLNKFDQKLILQVIQIAINDTVNVRREYHLRRRMALHTNHLQCCMCDTDLNTEPQCVLFQCQHISHRICQRSDICLACQLESDALFFKAEIQKRLLKDAGIKVPDQKPIPASVRKKSRPEDRDAYVIQLDTAEDVRRKTRHRMKKFDLEMDACSERLDLTFESYFDAKKDRKPMVPVDLELIDV